MKRKPSGPKYRNLVARKGTIYYQRWVRDASGRERRFRFSCKTSSWDEAASCRDLFEARKGIALGAVATAEVPRLEDFAPEYLERDTGHLAATTLRDRGAYLAEDGPILPHLGGRRLDELTAQDLRAWWDEAVTARGRTTATGRHYLNTLAALLGYARELGHVAEDAPDPVAAFRRSLSRRGRTKRRRADADHPARPVEEPAAIARLLTEARAEGAEAEVLVLLQLDAGLRLGEALGLTWGQVEWGAGPEDRTRALYIDRSRPRGGPPEAPKSGRTRRVALSRRLRAALQSLHRSRWQPGPEAAVLDGVDPGNFRSRDWRRVCARAGVGHRAMKDLRDTFASQLLTAGIPLVYVSRQLGHASTQLTERHYARWCAGDDYREPLRLGPGELPADLLARLAGTPAVTAETPQRPHPGPEPASEPSPATGAERRNLLERQGIAAG